MQAYIEKFGKQRVQMMLPRMQVSSKIASLLATRYYATAVPRVPQWCGECCSDDMNYHCTRRRRLLA